MSQNGRSKHTITCNKFQIGWRVLMVRLRTVAYRRYRAQAWVSKHVWFEIERERARERASERERERERERESESNSERER